MSETWKDIPGYEGHYQVSDSGFVRSVDREVPTSDGKIKRLRGVLLRHGQTQQGYRIVNLSLEGNTKMHTVHSLVMLAFVGPRPFDREICHGPGGIGDNAITNLRYGTHIENERDKLRDGTRTGVKVVRDDGKTYNTLTDAAKDTGTSAGSIIGALNGFRGQLMAGGHKWRRA